MNKSPLIKKFEDALHAIAAVEPEEGKREILTEMVKKPLLTNADFAILFSIDVRSCHRWRKIWGIPYLKLIGRVYYLWPSILPILLELEIRSDKKNIN